MTTRRTSYSLGLDELLGMTKSKNVSQKLESPILERPTTRHGRNSATGSSGVSTANSDKSKENKSPPQSNQEDILSNRTIDVWSNENINDDHPQSEPSKIEQYSINFFKKFKCLKSFNKFK
uniref:Uncharacterized protein n=1 Tax=Panagrolaimus superbus TaxID=310955 RepID=A0A914Z4Z9_9BILA